MSDRRPFQPCRWQVDGQSDILESDILEQVELPLRRAEEYRMDVEGWLQGLGLERYVPAFRDNEIDWEVLPKLTSDASRDARKPERGCGQARLPARMSEAPILPMFAV
jgi:hypothetical protein